MKSPLCLGYIYDLGDRLRDVFDPVLPVNYNEQGLEHWAEHVCFFELNIRDPLDIDNWTGLQYYLETTRKHYIDTTMHLPFLEAPASKQVKDLKMQWLVVPKSYNGGLKAEELDPDVLEDFIDLACYADIDYMTMHVTAPKYRLSRREFRLYKNRIRPFAELVESRGRKLCIETGGISEKQLLELNKDLGTLITLDTVHAKLDGMDYEKFYKDHKDIIPIIHLSQTHEGEDLHLRLEEKGSEDYTDFLRTLSSEEDDKYILLETNPNTASLEYIKDAIKGHF